MDLNFYLYLSLFLLLVGLFIASVVRRKRRERDAPGEIAGSGAETGDPVRGNGEREE